MLVKHIFPILVMNGPNLNMLGQREPHIYGSTTLEEIESHCSKLAEAEGFKTLNLHSNSEGQLIDWLQEAWGKTAGILINPGGLAHTSVVLRDALAMLEVPKIEVHLSNVYAREEFRQISLVSPVVDGVIAGLGVSGYYLGMNHLLELLTEK